VSANGKEEVYDLVQDPSERRDVAGVDAKVNPLRELFAQLDNGRRPETHVATRPGLDSGTLQALRSLGYVN
jgi:hypothetical protein